MVWTGRVCLSSAMDPRLHVSVCTDSRTTEHSAIYRCKVECSACGSEHSSAEWVFSNTPCSHVMRSIDVHTIFLGGVSKHTYIGMNVYPRQLFRRAGQETWSCRPCHALHVSSNFTAQTPPHTCHRCDSELSSAGHSPHESVGQ